MVKQKAYELLQETINQGIDALGRFLESDLKKHLFLIMHDGMEYYPAKKPAAEELRRVIKYLPVFADDQFYYVHDQQLLVLQVSSPDQAEHLYILIRKVMEMEIQPIMKEVDTARLALVCFLSSEISVARRVRKKTDDILSRAFESRHFSVEDILTDHGIRLDKTQEYRIMLVDFGKPLSESTTVDFKANLLQFARKQREVALYPLIWRGKGVVILRENGSREDLSASEVDDSLRSFVVSWQKSFSKRYGISLSIGIGDSHPLKELQVAYREARVVLAYGQTKNQTGFCKSFHDIGLLRPLFAGGIEPVLTFCRQTLGRLMDYDRENDADFLITLKLLMETNFNYKAAAEMLFVHVNTVRYRYDKIAQLLEKDLSDPDVRFDLYVAVRMSEIFGILHLLPVGYIGDVREKQHGRTASGEN